MRDHLPAGTVTFLYTDLEGAGRKLGSHDGIIRRQQRPGKTHASRDIPAHSHTE